MDITTLSTTYFCQRRRHLEGADGVHVGGDDGGALVNTL